MEQRRPARPSRAVDLTAEQVVEAAETVLLPLVRLVRAGLPHLRRSSSGRILAITTTGVREPTPGMAASNAVRPGIHGYLKTLAAELGPDGITVNTLAPGRIATPRRDEIYPDGVPPHLAEEIPLRRWERPGVRRRRRVPGLAPSLVRDGHDHLHRRRPDQECVMTGVRDQFRMSWRVGFACSV